MYTGINNPTKHETFRSSEQQKWTKNECVYKTCDSLWYHKGHGPFQISFGYQDWRFYNAAHACSHPFCSSHLIKKKSQAKHRKTTKKQMKQNNFLQKMLFISEDIVEIWGGSIEEDHFDIANTLEAYFAIIEVNYLRLIAFAEGPLITSKQHFGLKHRASPHFWVRFRQVTLFPNHFSIPSCAPEASHPEGRSHQLRFKAFGRCRSTMIYSHGSLFISSQCVWATTVTFHLMFQVIWP